MQLAVQSIKILLVARQLFNAQTLRVKPKQSVIYVLTTGIPVQSRSTQLTTVHYAEQKCINLNTDLNTLTHSAIEDLMLLQWVIKTPFYS